MNQPVDWTPPVSGLFGSSFRLGEWISGPVTPLFEDWALTRLEAAMHAAHRSLVLTTSEFPWIVPRTCTFPVACAPSDSLQS
jgi:hypothetical protein